MTGYRIVSRPSIAKSGVPAFREALQRHARIVGGVDPTSRNIGGYAGVGQGMRVNGGAGTTPFGSLEAWYGCTANGQGVEWDLGLLESNADWTINFYYFQNTQNAQVGIFMNDVQVGAMVEQYGVAGTQATSQRVWSPPASTGRLCHRVSVRVVGKHASSTNRTVSVGALILSRNGVAADRAL